ncbi:hypothetical protein ACFL6C_10205 [Myxococcota bacterium]
MKTKRCTRCGRVLPIGEFHRRQHYVKSGVRAACKDCTREAQRATQCRILGDKSQLQVVLFLCDCPLGLFLFLFLVDISRERQGKALPFNRFLGTVYKKLSDPALDLHKVIRV